jgi:hypothetical protein
VRNIEQASGAIVELWVRSTLRQTTSIRQTTESSASSCIELSCDRSGTIKTTLLQLEVMAIPSPLLIRLPPALRCHIFASTQSTTASLRASQWLRQQPFSNTSRHLQQSRPPPPKPRPIRNNTLTPTPTKQPPPALTAVRSRPLPRPVIPPVYSNLLNHTGRVLLYRAPPHKSFMINSYFVAIVFLGAGILHATAIPAATTLLARFLPTLVVIFYAAVFARTMYAPVQLIKEIWLVSRNTDGVAKLSTNTTPRSSSNMMVEFRTTQFIPFMPSTAPTMIVPLKSAAIDSTVQSKNLQYYTVPAQPDQLLDFTKSKPLKQELGLLESFRRNMARMFMRDGMAYVRVADGNWKLDVHGCVVADDGKVLEEVMRLEHRELSGWRLRLSTWLRRD